MPDDPTHAGIVASARQPEIVVTMHRVFPRVGMGAHFAERITTAIRKGGRMRHAAWIEYGNGSKRRAAESWMIPHATYVLRMRVYVVSPLFSPMEIAGA